MVNFFQSVLVSLSCFLLSCNLPNTGLASKESDLISTNEGRLTLFMLSGIGVYPQLQKDNELAFMLLDSLRAIYIGIKGDGNINEIVACSGSGSALVTGTINTFQTPFTFSSGFFSTSNIDLTFQLNQCNEPFLEETRIGNLTTSGMVTQKGQIFSTTRRIETFSSNWQIQGSQINTNYFIGSPEFYNVNCKIQFSGLGERSFNGNVCGRRVDQR